MINQNTLFFVVLGAIVGFIAGSTSVWLNVQVFSVMEWVFIGVLGGLAVKLGLIK